MSKKNYWFKRRRYGYGWIPVSMGGYVSVAVFMGILLGAGFWIEANESPTNLLIFVGVLFADMLGILLVGMLRGPKPKWRWGKTDQDNPEEDW